MLINYRKKKSEAISKIKNLRLVSCLYALASMLLPLASESYAYTWQNPELIDAGTGDAFRTGISFDPDGNAIAVFEQNTNGVYRIYANQFLNPSTPTLEKRGEGRFDKGGWQKPVIIDDGPRNAYMSRVVFDRSGDAIAIFKQSDGYIYRIYANHFIRNMGWQKPVAIDGGTGDADGQQIALDKNGDAVVVFEQRQKDIFRIYANQYKNHEGWKGAVAIDKGEGNGYFPYPVFDYKGNIYVIYLKEESGGLEVYTSIYDKEEKKWNEPFRLTDGWTIVKDEDWNKKRSDVNRGIKGIYNPLFLSEIKKRIYAGNYAYNVKRFETPSKIDSRFRDAYTPSAISDKSGHVFVFFVKWDGEHQRGYTVIYREGGWSKPEIIDAKGGDVEHIRAAINSAGEIALVFAQWIENKQEARSNENLRIHARLYNPDSGWGDAKIIDAGRKDSYGPAVIFNGDNEIIVIWCQWEIETVKTYRNDYIKERGWGNAVRVEMEDETCGGCGLRIAASPDRRLVAIFELKVSVRDRTKIYAIEGRK